jgi:hypothetical protein
MLPEYRRTTHRSIAMAKTHKASIGAVAKPGPLSPSPGWATAMAPGPDARVKISEGYARMMARDAYFWAWPLVNIYNRRLAFAQCPKPMLMNGVLPFAPLNALAMLSDYISPQQRWVACPNQDVVYGAAIAALDLSPVVVQVPDFGERFWVYQVVDIRTDAFARIGKMHGTTPGFYLLVGPDWQGEIPPGISQVFRASTSTAFVVPRVFQDDTAEDRQAIQSVIAGIDVYPLAAFDGKPKRQDWSKLPKSAPAEAGSDAGETHWVFPDKFFQQLPQVMKDAPPLPGEEARYAQIRAVIEAAGQDPALLAAMVDEATKCEEELIAPLLQFRNWGLQLGNHWSSVDNTAAFGTDYFARTAVAKSNILVNAPRETKYLYQDLDGQGQRLNGARRYTVTFPKGQTPPAHGFWSLTLYDAAHFFVPNELDRYSLGTKNKDLQTGSDGSLTIYVQADPPPPAQRANWLPSPKGDFSLYLRAYWPQDSVIDGSWVPPPVERQS